MTTQHDLGAIRPAVQFGFSSRGGHDALETTLHEFPGGEAVVEATGFVGSPAEVSLSLPADYMCVAYVRQGSSLVWCEAQRHVVLPGHSAIFCRQPQTSVRLGRGAHAIRLFYTPLRYVEGILAWVASRYEGTLPIPRLFYDDAMPNAPIPGVDDETDLGLHYSWIAFLAGAEPVQHGAHLVPPYAGEGSPFSMLMQAVRSAPAESWSLKRAAEVVSYSTFHFSRTFRAVTRMGFPDFVDKSRTELALARTVYTADALEAIATECGYASAAALRTALKEHTGFLPSELRTYLA